MIPDGAGCAFCWAVSSISILEWGSTIEEIAERWNTRIEVDPLNSKILELERYIEKLEFEIAELVDTLDERR